MKYAIVDGQRREAETGLSGECPCCHQRMTAKCGKINIWHWAHLGKLTCDTWWENETEWHRNWKSNFPDGWQEIVHTAKDGEKHIADVKTIKDWVIEFQHSHINPDERRARNHFYEKLVWVVDGTRRLRDKKKFFDSLSEVNSSPNPNSPVLRVFRAFHSEESPLVRDWIDSPFPVFFDFGKEERVLWCLLPKNSYGDLYVLEFLRDGFITFHRNELAESDFFADLINNFKTGAVQLSSSLRAQAQYQSYPQLSSRLQKDLFRQARARSLRRL